MNSKTQFLAKLLFIGIAALSLTTNAFCAGSTPITNAVLSGSTTVSGTVAGSGTAPTISNFSLTAIPSVTATSGSFSSLASTALNATSATAGTLTVSGTASAASFVGSGASLTNLNASALASGTISTGQLPIIPSTLGGSGTVNGILKANGSGVVSSAVSGTDYLAPNGSGAALTGITAAQVNALAIANNLSEITGTANYSLDQATRRHLSVIDHAFAYDGAITSSTAAIGSGTWVRVCKLDSSLNNVDRGGTTLVKFYFPTYNSRGGGCLLMVSSAYGGGAPTVTLFGSANTWKNFTQFRIVQNSNGCTNATAGTTSQQRMYLDVYLPSVTTDGVYASIWGNPFGYDPDADTLFDLIWSTDIPALGSNVWTYNVPTFNCAFYNYGASVFNGHMISSGSAPTISAGASGVIGSGTSASAVLGSTADDMAGALTITTGTGTLASGTAATLTFNTAFNNTPVVIAQSADANAVNVKATNVSTTGFSIYTTGTLSTSSTYHFSYHVIGK